MSPVIAALPRSPLHVKLLVDNQPDVDVVYYRDERLRDYLPEDLAQRAVYLGREGKAIGGIGDVLRLRRSNKAYYAGVAREITGRTYAKFIVFLENEPLEQLVFDTVDRSRIELWEEGLSHYFDLQHPVGYRVRALAQLALGFYPNRIFSTRADRAGLVVRDRLVEGSLRFVPEAGPRLPRDEVLYVASPLVEDRLVSFSRYVATIGWLAEASPVPVRYLTHPRQSEDFRRRLGDALAGQGARFAMEPDRRGVLKHCADFSYRCYVSGFSSALIDIGDFGRSAFIAPILGLGRIGRILLKNKVVPIRTFGSRTDLIDWIMLPR